MPSFHSGPVEIAYLDEGEGDPVFLVHGFASTKEINWVQPGWVAALVGAGRRVIALDNRGHGRSGKLYDAADYSIEAMADDVIALMDHVHVPCADVMGYSMGGRITTSLALRYPRRVRSAIIAGIGRSLIAGGGPGENVAQALEASALEDVSDRMGRTFRIFADQTKSDRRALAACMRGSRRLFSPDEVSRITVPVLIAVGTTDDIAGPARDLAVHIRGAEVLDIPGRDHMRAVGDKIYKEGVMAFLARRP
jgi:pimeloyl-ACP methyl ester carboxylesterase